jgi:hypothetical protein
MNKFLRAIIRAIPKPVRRAIDRVAFFGNRRHCPVCGRSARMFLRTGVARRPDARCPFCNSVERHRMLWRYLQEETDFFRNRDARMLHVAAEDCFEPRFRQQLGAGYTSADFMKPADVKMDVQNIQFPDATFDIVFCSHVLEHVPDDRKAMREMHRVLKPAGWAIIMVPITAAQTFEDPSVTDPQERLRLFGQHDHVRCYGPDFVDRLEDAGFNVVVTRAADFLTAGEIERIAASHPMTGEVFHCTKA